MLCVDVSSFPHNIKIYCTGFFSVHRKFCVCTKPVRTCWLCTKCTQSQLVSPVVWLLRHRDYWAVSRGQSSGHQPPVREESVVDIRDPETTESFRDIVTPCDGDREREGPCHVSEAEHGCDLAWPRIQWQMPGEWPEAGPGGQATLVIVWFRGNTGATSQTATWFPIQSPAWPEVEPAPSGPRTGQSSLSSLECRDQDCDSQCLEKVLWRVILSELSRVTSERLW